ncbi:MAG: hypothetical protein JWQ98_3390 [Chlorobi bacterium]|nr:hypothetical protein [Chlorobiota bacterium]
MIETDLSDTSNIAIGRNRPREWSIGIYLGDSPLAMRDSAAVRNPVITRDDVTDRPARFVADPFMLRDDGIWYMFFEVLDDETNRGEIALATSLNGLEWRYRGVVLSEPFHLSYPYVFAWEGEHYMVPESLKPNAARLYRAANFPSTWEHVADLIPGWCADSSLMRHGGLWWIFTCPNPSGRDILRLYYADDLRGSWTEHPASPIVQGNAAAGRPGGRVIEYAGRLIRYSQDCSRIYGEAVLAFEILVLDRDRYSERAYGGNPVLAPTGHGWNGACMHTIDPHPLEGGGWIACVDGHYLGGGE